MSGLGRSDQPLRESYDLAVLDLDGVVYLGAEAVPGAARALESARDAGMRLAFVTNNAARPPSAVGDHLRRLGVEAADEDVVTSAQAAARLLSDRLPKGSPVFLVGGEGLHEALVERGLRPVTDPGEDPAAVVQGYAPDLPYQRIVQGAILVASGLPWVASNTDLTIPTAGGVGPGNGALVRLVAEFAGRQPEVAGKPEPPLFEETLARVGGDRPLVVGDRLDTDIAGAVRMGWDSLVVLTGVTGLEELVRAGPEERPTYVAPDLAGLGTSHAAPEVEGDVCRLEGWEATVRDGALRVQGDGAAEDWWRVVAVTAWRHLDDVGEPVLTDGVSPPE